MKKLFVLLTSTAVLLVLMLIYSLPIHAQECKKLDAFVEMQSANFPDLVITKLIPLKAQLLVDFVNKFTKQNFHGDVVIVGVYTNKGVDRVGYAIFDKGCMVYGEAISAEEWKAVQPVIFGKNT